jgi:hypothetical protein
MIYPVEEEAQDARKAIEATLAKAVAIVTPGP